MKPSKRDPRVYLDDILAAILKIETYVKGGEKDFFGDGKTQDAVLMQMAIIGEASSKLPPVVRSEHSDLPWKKIIGMRNVIIHEYSEINLAIVWDVVENDLSVLKGIVKEMLDRLGPLEE